MNYQTAYDSLISKRLSDTATGYTEKHHILPKSMGGSNDPSNLVVLTAREHWIAHLLLHKIHRCSQTAFACSMMAVGRNQEVKTSRIYQYVREENSKFQSQLGKQRIGKKNGSFGTRWICNVDLKENRKVPKEDLIPDGWVAGRNKWIKNIPNCKCPKCGIAFYSPKNQKFCSRSCSAVFNHVGRKCSDEKRLKLSIAAKRRNVELADMVIAAG